MPGARPQPASLRLLNVGTYGGHGGYGWVMPGLQELESLFVYTPQTEPHRHVEAWETSK